MVFKIGDKVKIIKDITGENKNIGEIAKIIAISTSNPNIYKGFKFPIKIKTLDKKLLFCSAEEIELLEGQDISYAN